MQYTDSGSKTSLGLRSMNQVTTHWPVKTAVIIDKQQVNDNNPEGAERYYQAHVSLASDALL